jgi:hypothetical protein
MKILHSAGGDHLFMNALPVGNGQPEGNEKRRLQNASRLRGRERGMVLVTTLVIALLVGIVVGAMMIIIQQQNSLVARSRTWCSEIPIAEAGIEEAMTHLNTLPADLATSGWTLNGTNFVKTRTIGDGYYYVEISSNAQPTIISIGFGRIPTQTNYSQRTVMVTTKRATVSGYGVVAKGVIKMSGTNYIDSFDSSDPAYSSNGLYTVSRRLDDVMVGSLSSSKPAIDNGGNGSIYGQAATGPMGTAVGTIGDGAWNANSANAGKAQDGHVTDDFNMAIPDVSAPYSVGTSVPAWPLSPAPRIITLSNDDYRTTTLAVSAGSTLVISGKVRLYVTSTFSTSGTGLTAGRVTILAGGSLELYVGGTCTLSGAGVVNGTQNAANCAIYGLPTCTAVTYSGSSAFIGQVYAPAAAFTFNGVADACGAFTAKSISLSGSAGVHYDKALGRPSGPYLIDNWAEL